MPFNAINSTGLLRSTPTLVLLDRNHHTAGPLGWHEVLRCKPPPPFIYSIYSPRRESCSKKHNGKLTSSLKKSGADQAKPEVITPELGQLKDEAIAFALRGVALELAMQGTRHTAGSNCSSHVLATIQIIVTTKNGHQLTGTQAHVCSH